MKFLSGLLRKSGKIFKRQNMGMEGEEKVGGGMDESDRRESPILLAVDLPLMDQSKPLSVPSMMMVIEHQRWLEPIPKSDVNATACPVVVK